MNQNHPPIPRLDLAPKLEAPSFFVESFRLPAIAILGVLLSSSFAVV